MRGSVESSAPLLEGFQLSIRRSTLWRAVQALALASLSQSFFEARADVLIPPGEAAFQQGQATASAGGSTQTSPTFTMPGTATATDTDLTATSTTIAFFSETLFAFTFQQEVSDVATTS